MKKWIIGILVLLFAISVYVVAQPRNKQSVGNKLSLVAKMQSAFKTYAEYNYEAVTANNDSGTVLP